LRKVSAARGKASVPVREVGWMAGAKYDVCFARDQFIQSAFLDRVIPFVRCDGVKGPIGIRNIVWPGEIGKILAASIKRRLEGVVREIANVNVGGEKSVRLISGAR
jgi:hypothetical protein